MMSAEKNSCPTASEASILPDDGGGGGSGGGDALEEEEETLMETTADEFVTEEEIEAATAFESPSTSSRWSAT